MNQCIFSPCRRYRYTLQVEWWSETMLPKPERPRTLQVIGLNPSTADESQLDPTLRRCVGFAKRWGFDQLVMTNLFAWRDTKPANMKKAEDPIGPENDAWLAGTAQKADMVLAAWGMHGDHLHRDVMVQRLLARHGVTLHALRPTKHGHPGHPLYVPGDEKPNPFLCAGPELMA